MKTKKYYIIILLIFIFILSSCNSDSKVNTVATIAPTATPTLEPSPNVTSPIIETNENVYEFDADQYRRFWYDNMINGLKQDTIQNSVEQANAIAEYRIIYDYSFLGIMYYSLKVYDDWTGEFSFIVFNSEFFNLGTFLVNEQISLTEDETKDLIKILNDNEFWSIPTIHPDERLGLDGYTIFIEGYSSEESHLITMWQPKEKYGIYKIAEVFRDFGKTIVDNPLDEYAW